MPDPTLSVLIVTYNSVGVIGDCLDSLRASPSSREFEVVIADNGSDDGTVERVRSSYPEAVLVENGANLGFARGNRSAAGVARGDLLLLLNPDTVVRPGAVDALVASLLAEESRWVVGACLVGPDGEPATSWGDFPTLGWAFLELAPWRRLGLAVRSMRQVGRTCEGVERAKDVDWVSGAALLVRRDAWDRLGGLDGAFFMYFEETDFCARVHACGGRVVLEPDARIVHLEGASVGQASIRQRVWFARSLLLFMRRNAGSSASTCVAAWLWAVNSILWLLSIPVGLFSVDVRRQRSRYAALARVAVGRRVPEVDGQERV
jgi:N-acetylglucosaminyl-diphospho-decaprenol L-rhamnosyltransferase